MSNTSKYPLVASQPFRLLYQLFKASLIAASLPYWLVISLVPALRPNRHWTFLQTLMARVLRAFMDMESTIGMGESETQSLRPPPGEGDRFVVVQPFQPDLCAGPLTSDPSVKPAAVGGLWRPDTPSDVASLHKIVLHIHGGAFVRDHPDTSAAGFLSKTLLTSAGVDAVFVPLYRLSGYNGQNPFPAALQDALTSYLYLVRTLGARPAAVTLSGDSAGGNIAIALLRYIDAFGEPLGIPRPGRAFLVAPWVAPPRCHPLRAAGELAVEEQPLYASDILPGSFLRWGIRAYAPGGDVDKARGNPYIHHLGHPFRLGVPLLVSMGSVEVLSTDGAAWAREMDQYEGGGVNHVEVHFEENAPHDTLLVGDLLKWEDSARTVAVRIGKFIREN